jgi:hypothetical protein
VSGTVDVVVDDVVDDVVDVVVELVVLEVDVVVDAWPVVGVGLCAVVGAAVEGDPVEMEGDGDADTGGTVEAATEPGGVAITEPSAVMPVVAAGPAGPADELTAGLAAFTPGTLTPEASGRPG